MMRLIVGAGLLAMLASRAEPLVAQGGKTVAMARSGDVVQATTTRMTGTVTVRFENTPLVDALQVIAEQSGVPMVFSPTQVPDQRVTYAATNVSVDVALAAVLRGTVMRAERVPGGGFKVSRAPVTQGTITGTVTNAKTGKPIAGATVLLDDATKGVITGEDGSFRVQASAGEHTIHVRGLGFTRQARRVTVTDEQSVVVSVSLEPSTSVLNEVVVTGTVVATERKAIPTPITVITAADLEKRNVTRIDQLFRGDVPGVIALEQGTLVYSSGDIFNGTGKLGGAVTSQVFSRGASSLANGSTTPLKTYVDGVELLDPSYLGTIDPKSIEKIEIITGPQAATIYGSGAMGGVMNIFTKKGSGRSTPDVTMNFRYGVLQNNMSAGKTPMHNDAVTLAGGAGPIFTYSGNLSYNYTGQWLPGLFMRQYGASVGVSHARGPLTAGGSVSVTSGSNGTIATSGCVNCEGVLGQQLTDEGVWYPGAVYNPYSSRISTSSSQTLALNLDYRLTPWWQHHATVGRSQNVFELVPQAPDFAYTLDTLFKSSSGSGRRNTLNYNTTLMGHVGSALSSMFTLGADGSWGASTQTAGCTPTKSASTLVKCGDYINVTVTRPISDKNVGGYATWQVGMWDRAFVTLAVRGDQNPNYGAEHRIDWTPRVGGTYTIERGDLTLKLLASYGRATRPPLAGQRLQAYTFNTVYSPSQWVSVFASPELTPEYSHGPEGGFELYYGNWGSLTVNHYRQTVSDLIQRVKADSLQVTIVSSGTQRWITQYQYRNAVDIAQRGWEATGTLNMGPLSFRGTYSWTDSRVQSVRPEVVRFVGTLYDPGSEVGGAPTHMGSASMTYARGKTSVSFFTNYVGQSLQSLDQTSVDLAGYYFFRTSMYTSRVDGNFSQVMLRRPGYTKSDLAVSQRLTPWASAVVNVTNLGNSYGSETNIFNPTLGRQTLMGVTLQFPKK